MKECGQSGNEKLCVIYLSEGQTKRGERERENGSKRDRHSLSANGAERTFTGIGKPRIYSGACASFCLPLIRQKQCQAQNKKDERKSQPNP